MDSIRQLPARTIAAAAAAAVVAFPCLVVTANVVQRDHYSATREAVSNLALGQAGWLMTLAFLSLGTGTLLLALVVRRLVTRAIFGPGFLLAGGCTTLLSAVFRTDAENASSSLHGTIHMALGLGSFVLVISAITACSISFLRSRSHRRLGVASAVWALAAFSAIVLTFALPQSLFGVGQRAFLAAAVSWMAAICVFAIRHGETTLRQTWDVAGALEM